MKIKRYILLTLIFLFGLSAHSPDCKVRPTLIIFYSSTCSKCLEINHEFMPKIEAKYKDKIDILYLNIDDMQNYKLLLSYEESFDKRKKTLPIVFMEGKFLSGETEVKKHLEEVILDSLKRESMGYKEALPKVDLISRFKSFSILAIIFAGLIDGINPCAFTVIVFFITFLTFQKFRKKEILFTGLCFIFAVFLTYLLLGLGLFRVLYSLRLFYFVSRLIYILIALLAFVLGTLTIYDIVKFKKTHQAQDLVLGLPERIKYYIHSIIGLHYRQKQSQEQYKKSIFRLIISAFICGVLISLLEAVCTGQIYLPTITFVLKVSSLKIQALTYLVLYNLMFIIPLLLVFFFALLGVSSAQFSNFMRKHIVITKILMAGLFFGLGLILIWKV